MEKCRRFRPSEQPREQNLAACGVEQVLAAHDEVDVLNPVVHGDGELVGPVAFAIAHRHVTALLVRMLCLRAEPQIVEANNALVEPYAKSEAGRFAQVFLAAGTGIALAFEVRTRAFARVRAVRGSLALRARLDRSHPARSGEPAVHRA